MNNNAPGTCNCGGFTEVVDGQHVPRAGEMPIARKRRRGDTGYLKHVPLPYWLRARRCLSCGDTWSTVELRLKEVSDELNG